MPVTISRWSDLQNPTRFLPALDEIFFQSSNTQSFADATTRAAFRERWLGRYLTNYPEYVYLALSADDQLAGYLAGCLDDPAVLPLFSDIVHYRTFADLTRKYPAHLHVNLSPTFRSAGIGSQLVTRFCADAKHAGVPGVHVMTSQNARNVSFYLRNGFEECGVTGSGSAAVVFLARQLRAE